MNTDEILEDRGKRYGNYLDQTKISQELIGVMQFWWKEKKTRLASDQIDALMMIAVKISRIINGDPDYADNWADISGYSKLVADRLEERT